MLLGNVLRWETGYLGRQHPVLPAAPGFVRKVKPLVRLGEREMAAYCVLRGIDYLVEECPMAEGNRHLGYKEVLNALEDRSPGDEGGVPVRLPRPGARALRRRRGEPSARRWAHARECGSPTTGEVCAFCRLQRVHGRHPCSTRAGAASGPRAPAGTCRAPDRGSTVAAATASCSSTPSGAATS